MNTPLLKQDLYRDAIAAAATRRRKIRLTQRVGSAALVSLAALFLTLPHKQEINPPVVAKAAAPVQRAYEIIQSDEELLGWVADQGPALVTRPDGRRVLILTTANR
jgi:hypothetical protein